MSSLKQYFIDFTSLFYPKLCNACRKSLVYQEEIICTYCLYRLPKTGFAPEKENKVSEVFWGRVPLEGATSFLYFQKGGIVQKLMHQFKYKGKKQIGVYLGMLMGKELAESPWFKNTTLIVPVPLHPARQHKRGYNQSDLICQGLGKAMEKQIVYNNLIRKTQTATQTRKSKFKRWENVEAVFHIQDPKVFQNQHILLVDDVITTGATLEACAQKLTAIEGTTVSVATLAMAV